MLYTHACSAHQGHLDTDPSCSCIHARLPCPATDPNATVSSCGHSRIYDVCDLSGTWLAVAHTAITIEEGGLQEWDADLQPKVYQHSATHDTVT